LPHHRPADLAQAGIDAILLDRRDPGRGSTMISTGLFALGYGGNAITFSLIAAEIIRGCLVNRPNPDLPIFSFDR